VRQADINDSRLEAAPTLDVTFGTEDVTFGLEAASTLDVAFATRIRLTNQLNGVEAPSRCDRFGYQ